MAPQVTGPTRRLNTRRRKGAHPASRVLLAAALAPLSATASAIGRPAEAQDEAPTPSAVDALGYRFENHFWTNLHHYLYLEAVRRGRGGTEAQRVGAGLEGADLARWNEAIAHYTDQLVSRSLLFDRGMRRLDAQLGEVEAAADLEPSGVEPALAQVLERAEPVYREHYWTEHQAANARWYAALEPLLEEHGRDLARRLSEVYATPWPAQPIRVDVLAYANWAGAYTSYGPNHIRVSSLYPGNDDPVDSFETLFHETSHLLVTPTSGSVAEAIGAACREVELEVPSDLWHVILFVTAGELTRHSGAAPDEYVPYAERVGLYRDDWGRLHAALERPWLAYMDGKTSLEECLAAVAADLAAAD